MAKCKVECEMAMRSSYLQTCKVKKAIIYIWQEVANKIKLSSELPLLFKTQTN